VHAAHPAAPVHQPTAAQVVAVTRAMLSVVAGDAVDDALLEKLRALTSEHSIARAILGLQVRACVHRSTSVCVYTDVLFRECGCAYAHTCACLCVCALFGFGPGHVGGRTSMGQEARARAGAIL